MNYHRINYSPSAYGMFSNSSIRRGELSLLVEWVVLFPFVWDERAPPFCLPLCFFPSGVVGSFSGVDIFVPMVHPMLTVVCWTSFENVWEEVFHGGRVRKHYANPIIFIVNSDVCTQQHMYRNTETHQTPTTEQQRWQRNPYTDQGHCQGNTRVYLHFSIHFLSNILVKTTHIFRIKVN